MTHEDDTRRELTLVSEFSHSSKSQLDLSCLVSEEHQPSVTPEGAWLNSSPEPERRDSRSEHRPLGPWSQNHSPVFKRCGFLRLKSGLSGLPLYRTY